ncbi:MAG: cation:proton antiporter [Deltaproteobacteria bacterium]|nr:cation:proton antiporter [Deltaproteobacteria bacterium]
MVDTQILQHLVFIIFISINIVFFLRRLRMPPLVGFLIAGALLGPYGFGLIKDPSEIKTIAEIGIILLLFSIGLEFPIHEFKRYSKLALWGGSLQIGLTIGITVLFSLFLGSNLYQSIFLGCILSLSSTSIVMKLLSEKGMSATVHGRIGIVLLIFQDLAVIPMLLLLPIFSGDAFEWNGFLIAILKISLFLSVIYFLNKFLIHRLFKEIVLAKNRELFVLSVMLLIFSVALLSQKLGISLALGAFIAGVMMASSQYSYQMSAHILSFRSFFESIFFISIGLLLNVSFVKENIFLILAILLFIFVGKTIICTFVFLIFRYSLSLSITAALTLSQIGEFSFILAKQGLDFHWIEPHIFQLTVSTALISMIATPLLFSYAQTIGMKIGQLKILSRWAYVPLETISALEKEPDGHVVLIGFGTVGQNLGKIFKKNKIQCIAVDAQLYNIQEAQKMELAAVLGDSTAPELLERARISRASAIVITIPDSIATQHIIRSIRVINPIVPIVCRATYRHEVEAFRSIGGENLFVTYTELEIIIDLLRHVLKRLNMSRDEIAANIESLVNDFVQLDESLKEEDFIII